MLDEPIESRVRHVDARAVRLDRAKWKVLRRDRAVRQRVIQRGLPHVGHTDDADLRRASERETRGASVVERRSRARKAHRHRDAHPPSGRDFRRRRRAIERVEAHLEVARESTERPRAEDFLLDDFFRGHGGRRFEVWGRRRGAGGETKKRTNHRSRTTAEAVDDYRKTLTRRDRVLNAP